MRERHTVATYSSAEDLSEKLGRDFRKLLESKKADGPVSSDEFELAASIIKKFLLVPNEFSGKEIRLKIKIKGEPYPASKEVCDSLSLVFGSTIGVNIEIVEPNGVGNSIEKLYIHAKQIDKLLPIQDGDEREIYAKLQFTPAKIERVRARFSPETRYEFPLLTSALSVAASFTE